MLVIEVDRIPGRAVTVPRVAGEVVLAEGEATGHRHAIADPDVELLRVLDELYLRVDGAATLEHQEHDPIPLPTGSYRVVRQREYAPEAPRPVFD